MNNNLDKAYIKVSEPYTVFNTKEQINCAIQRAQELLTNLEILKNFCKNSMNQSLNLWDEDVHNFKRDFENFTTFTYNTVWHTIKSNYIQIFNRFFETLPEDFSKVLKDYAYNAMLDETSYPQFSRIYKRNGTLCYNLYTFMPLYAYDSFNDYEEMFFEDNWLSVDISNINILTHSWVLDYKLALEQLQTYLIDIFKEENSLQRFLNIIDRDVYNYFNKLYKKWSDGDNRESHHHYLNPKFVPYSFDNLDYGFTFTFGDFLHQ